MLARHKRTRPFRIDEFTVFGAFVAVAVFGLVYGIVAVAVGKFDVSAGYEEPLLQPVEPPTELEYQTEARDVLSPFFGQALTMRQEDLSGDNSAMLQLVEKTQDRLLRVRVPADYREFHLSAVLLLDQWKRALAGSKPDRDAALGKTQELAKKSPWLTE
ncbi:MAG TPA: hypothetical protein VL500_05930 [Candidatus Eisenbacteria bacterium]|jgi:hypothetical protein|nr:hypothetical protein [Candidatus Eisenbacteria bacterium]